MKRRDLADGYKILKAGQAKHYATTCLSFIPDNVFSGHLSRNDHIKWLTLFIDLILVLLLARIYSFSVLTRSSISHEKRERDEISLMVSFWPPELSTQRRWICFEANTIARKRKSFLWWRRTMNAGRSKCLATSSTFSSLPRQTPDSRIDNRLLTWPLCRFAIILFSGTFNRIHFVERNAQCKLHSGLHNTKKSFRQTKTKTTSYEAK